MAQELITRYIARVSSTMWQSSYPLDAWAARTPGGCHLLLRSGRKGCEGGNKFGDPGLKQAGKGDRSGDLTTDKETQHTGDVALWCGDGASLFRRGYTAGQ
jgi:hypothetical protein